VFRGGSNAMTRLWAERCPSVSSPITEVAAQPASSPGEDSVLYKRETLEGKGIEQKIRNTRGNGRELLPRVLSTPPRRCSLAEAGVSSFIIHQFGSGR
jgi:hypothetical protein